MTQVRFVRQGESLKGIFYNHFEFDVSKDELERLGAYSLKGGELVVQGEKGQRRKTNLIDWKIDALKSKISKNPTLFIDEYSQIPLIGSLSFGLIDRDTTTIEVRLNTTCNLRCVYCSVGEGLDTFNKGEFLVDADYLVKGLRELVEYKGCEVDIHIGAQGEPMLYARIEELVQKIRAIPGIRTISMVSNGVLLGPEKLKALAEAGMDRLDLSFNALDPAIAMKMAGSRYDIEHVKRVAEAALEHMDVLLAPVWLPGMNDSEIEPLVRYAKKLGVRIGIQNYLPYRYGRNPSKPKPMDQFMEELKEIEKRLDYPLLLGPEDFQIEATKPLPKPFKRGDVVEVEIVSQGRHGGERLGKAQNRVITVTGCRQNDQRVHVKITRSKHNIFYGRRV